MQNLRTTVDGDNSRAAGVAACMIDRPTAHMCMRTVCALQGASARAKGEPVSEVLTVTGSSAIGFVLVSSTMLLVMYFFLNRAFFIVLVGLLQHPSAVRTAEPLLPASTVLAALMLALCDYEDLGNVIAVCRLCCSAWRHSRQLLQHLQPSSAMCCQPPCSARSTCPGLVSRHLGPGSASCT